MMIRTLTVLSSFPLTTDASLLTATSPHRRLTASQLGYWVAYPSSINLDSSACACAAFSSTLA